MPSFLPEYPAFLADHVYLPIPAKCPPARLLTCIPACLTYFLLVRLLPASFFPWLLPIMHYFRVHNIPACLSGSKPAC